ncbi:hypothetical protein A6R68_01988, partial [Neotoma lepida]
VSRVLVVICIIVISMGLLLYMIGDKLITFSEETSIWEGLWNFCEADGLQILKCMLYDSLTVLPQDLQVSGVLMVICIIITSLGLLLYLIGDKLITCESLVNVETKIKMATSGLFLVAGLLMLVPVSLDLQVSRVLVVICIIITLLGLLLYMIGDQPITCVSIRNVEENMKMVARGEQKCTMVRQELEAASISLAMLGWLVAIIICGLPSWRVIKVSEETSIWEGLWNLCEAEGLKSLRCMTYNSRPFLPEDLKVSGVLVVICIIITFLGLLLFLIGDKLITPRPDTLKEEILKLAASVLFLGAGLLMLVSVSWVTHNVILGIGNPQFISQWKPEMGASLYLGGLSFLLLLLGGALLGGALLWAKD